MNSIRTIYQRQSNSLFIVNICVWWIFFQRRSIGKSFNWTADNIRHFHTSDSNWFFDWKSVAPSKTNTKKNVNTIHWALQFRSLFQSNNAFIPLVILLFWLFCFFRSMVSPLFMHYSLLSHTWIGNSACGTSFASSTYEFACGRCLITNWNHQTWCGDAALSVWSKFDSEYLYVNFSWHILLSQYSQQSRLDSNHMFPQITPNLYWTLFY